LHTNSTYWTPKKTQNRSQFTYSADKMIVTYNYGQSPWFDLTMNKKCVCLNTFILGEGGF
jgi:hypothetical protein